MSLSPGAAELACQTNTNSNNSVAIQHQASGYGDRPGSALSDVSEDLTLPSELFTAAKPTSDDHHDLPVMEHRDRILELIDTHQVICIQGETGCGKSTKVPQFVLDRAQAANPPEECRILVTQPRRMAAIKLAERVAGERHERVGKSVGYCIGGERHRSPSTALTYCTTGYMLQVGASNISSLPVCGKSSGSGSDGGLYTHRWRPGLVVAFTPGLVMTFTPTGGGLICQQPSGFD